MRMTLLRPANQMANKVIHGLVDFRYGRRALLSDAIILADSSGRSLDHVASAVSEFSDGMPRLIDGSCQ
jgi:hypothetical protein